MSAQTVAASVLPASEIERCLISALHDLDAARKNAVIWFGEILARKLYLEFGCSSIHHYARERLEFSRARTACFLRLCRSFEALPALRESVASGVVPWTKAREVVKTATPETESFWVEQARTTGRRELELRVATTRGAARFRRRAPGQGELLAAGADGTAIPTDVGDIAAAPVPIEVPVTVSFQLSPEQYARYEAILEQARKTGARGSREELFLAAWEMITRVAPPRRSAVPVDRSPTGRVAGDPSARTTGARGAGGTRTRSPGATCRRRMRLPRRPRPATRSSFASVRPAAGLSSRRGGARCPSRPIRWRPRCVMRACSEKVNPTARPSPRPSGGKCWHATVIAAARRDAAACGSWMCTTSCRVNTAARTTPRT